MANLSAHFSIAETDALCGVEGFEIGEARSIFVTSLSRKRETLEGVPDSNAESTKTANGSPNNFSIEWIGFQEESDREDEGRKVIETTTLRRETNSYPAEQSGRSKDVECHRATHNYTRFRRRVETACCCRVAALRSFFKENLACNTRSAFDKDVT